MNEKISVMMVEDHPEYREGVMLALETETDMELIRVFGTTEAALRALQYRKDCPKPDVILLDLNLPGMGGLEALPWFRDYVPKAKIIVLTQSDREDDVLSAISAGASGYLLKSATLDQITEGIRTVMDGGASLDANMATFILDTYKKIPPKAKMENSLTKRELEIITLLSEGLSKKEISGKLHISTPTVATHVAHIYEKFNVRNAPAAVAKAFRMGIFSTRKKV
ncbi:MAG: response regulator [Opitutae bacterium]|nr:response regulator [Opitutae bacterium]